MRHGGLARGGGQVGEDPIAEALRFVAAHPHVFLLARRRDGFPTGYAMMARVRNGCVEFSTYRASAKVRNVQRDGWASVLACTGGHEPLVLVASGPVEVLEDVGWGLDPVGEPSGPAATVPREVTETVRARHSSGTRVVLRLRVEHARFTSPAMRQ